MTVTGSERVVAADLWRPETLSQMLVQRARQTPDRLAFRQLVDGGSSPEALSFSELDRRARQVAELLRRREGFEQGERVLLLYPPGLDYICAVFGCAHAGVVAVPAYPPDPWRIERTLPRLASIAADADVSAVLSVDAIVGMAAAFAADAGGLTDLPWLATDAVEVAPCADTAEVSADDVAYIQYTSGSTGEPRGVVLSHAQVVQNILDIRSAAAVDSEAHVVSWLPTYHDMGLVCGIFTPVHAGISATQLSPLDFMQRPACWLEAISKYGGTHAGSPNFAYDLCVRRVRDEELEGLDLGSWQVAFNGAEPIRADSLRRFSRRFEAAGFRAEAFMPCYGLAEHVVGVTWSAPQSAPRSLWLDREALQARQVVEGAAHGAGSVELVSCGSPQPNTRVAIANPETGALLRDDSVGEIWLRGPAVARGYHGRVAESEATFGARSELGEGPFLRTGDLGFLSRGELVVTGRLKDLIIVRGKNFYPQDLERRVESAHPAIRAGCCAAFQLEESTFGCAVEIEPRRVGDATHEEIALRVGAHIALEFGVHPSTVALLLPRSIHKTSSGKIQRRACAQSLRDHWEGALYIHQQPVGEDPLLAATADRILSVAHRGAGDADAGGALPGADLALDSIQLVELQAHLLRRVGVAPPVELLLRATTVAEVAAWLRAHRVGTQAAASASASPKAERPTPPSWRGLRADLASAFLDGFLGKMEVASAALEVIESGAPVLFVANHQVASESMMFLLAARLRWQREIFAVAKLEHRESFWGRLAQQLASHPEHPRPVPLVFLDRGEPASLGEALSEVGERVFGAGFGLLVHVEGTRQLAGGQPLRATGGVFELLARRHGAAIIPVRFSRGLPRQRLDLRREFPVGYGKQDVYVGAPLEASVADRELGAAVGRHVDALGPPLDDEAPSPPAPALHRSAAHWRRRGASGEPAAVLLGLLEGLEEVSEEARWLLDHGAGASDTPPAVHAQWLHAVASCFFDSEGEE